MVYGSFMAIFECRNQRTWKLVDCKIYNDLTSGKSIQSQSTTTEGSCGLILDWFTTSWGVIDFAIHQLSGPLIHIPVWYINNFTIIKALKTQTFALQCKIDPSTTLLECKIGPSTTLLECKIGPSTTLLSFTRKRCV